MRWLDMLVQKATTFRNPASVAMTDIRRSDNVTALDHKLGDELKKDIAKGWADKLSEHERKYIKHVVAVRDQRLIDVFDNLNLLLLKHIKWQSWIEQAAAKLPPGQRDHVLQLLHKERAKIKEVVDTIVQAEAGFDSTTLSKFKMLDFSSNAHEAYFSMRKVRSDSRAIARDEKKELSELRSGKWHDDKLLQEFEDEAIRMKKAVETIIVMLQDNIAELGRRQQEVEELVAKHGFPDTIGKTIITLFTEERKRFYASLKERIERERIVLSQAERPAA